MKLLQRANIMQSKVSSTQPHSLEEVGSLQENSLPLQRIMDLLELSKPTAIYVALTSEFSHLHDVFDRLASVTSTKVAQQILEANPALAFQRENDPNEFDKYIKRLSEASPAIGAMVIQKSFVASDFSSLGALEKTIDRAYEEYCRRKLENNQARSEVV
jgi:hypothetical protein